MSVIIGGGSSGLSLGKSSSLTTLICSCAPAARIEKISYFSHISLSHSNHAQRRMMLYAPNVGSLEPCLPRDKDFLVLFSIFFLFVGFASISKSDSELDGTCWKNRKSIKLYDSLSNLREEVEPFMTTAHQLSFPKLHT